MLWLPWQQKVPFNFFNFSRLFFDSKSLYLQVSRTFIKSRTSSKFGQIVPPTTELAALKHLKIDDPLLPGCFNQIHFILAGNEDVHEILKELNFDQARPITSELAHLGHLKMSHRLKIKKMVFTC